MAQDSGTSRHPTKVPPSLAPPQPLGPRRLVALECWRPGWWCGVVGWWGGGEVRWGGARWRAPVVPPLPTHYHDTTRMHTLDFVNHSTTLCIQRNLATESTPPRCGGGLSWLSEPLRLRQRIASAACVWPTCGHAHRGVGRGTASPSAGCALQSLEPRAPTYCHIDLK